MSDINFLENENEFAVHHKTARETKSLTALLQKFGFAKDYQQARYILLCMTTLKIGKVVVETTLATMRRQI